MVDLAATLPLGKQEMGVSMDEEENKPAKRKLTPLRFKRAKSSAKLASVQNTVEVILGLPAGSVRFVTPKGKKVRSDASVRKLRAHWGD